MKVRLLVVALIGVLTPLLAVGPASAGTGRKTITFDEMSPRPADGLHTRGVTFGFTIAGAPSSTGATYGGIGPGKTRYVDDPVLEGDASGRLTLTFDRATTLVQFGLALSTDVSLADGFTVKLLNSSGTWLGTFPMRTKVRTTFTEALFAVKGLQVSKAVITFDRAHAPYFALDNLKYNSAA